MAPGPRLTDDQLILEILERCRVARDGGWTVGPRAFFMPEQKCCCPITASVLDKVPRDWTHVVIVDEFAERFDRSLGWVRGFVHGYDGTTGRSDDPDYVLGVQAGRAVSRGLLCP